MFEKIVDLILNYVDPENTITPDTEIKNELSMNSFDLVCLGDEIHQEFGIVLNADDFRECNTVGGLVSHIEKCAC